MQYRTIKNDIEDEIVEKKSKFIANIFYVETNIMMQSTIALHLEYMRKIIL